jgi:hypothetical protein
MAGSETCGTDTPDDVLGEEIAQEDGGIGAPVIPATPGDDVLGVTIQRDAERSGDAVAASDEAGAPTGEENALPFTGSDVIPLLLVAFGLLITGVATTRIRKNDR